MKVYVVTTGSYSDYEIAKIFLDRNKAEEFANWIEDSNGVDEWETSDDDFEFGELNNKVVVYATYYPYHNNNWFIINDTNYSFDTLRFNYCKTITKEHEHLTLYKLMPQNYNEDIIKKILFDKWAEIKSLLAEGYTEIQINEMINR